jgi:hypothetical protein
MKRKSTNNPLVRKNDLDGAVDAILTGMDSVIKEQDERNEKKFATKEDLKREIGWVRDDINGLKADLSDTPSRGEFKHLKSKVDKYLSS